MTSVEFSLNGAERTVEVEPSMPLLWALRDVIGLRGTKFGCGIGECGACTVHLDGEAVRSCRTEVGAVQGRRVTTIEGLSPDGTHPVQQAWQDLAVAQCGYCQPGQIMTAVALLAHTPRPTDAEVDDAFRSCLCRCGTYGRIRAAVQRAAGR